MPEMSGNAAGREPGRLTDAPVPDPSRRAAPVGGPALGAQHQHSEHPVGAGTGGLGHWRDPVVSRRVVLGAAAGATALTLAGPGSAREAHAARLAAAEQLGRLGAGTDFSVRVSPDGSTLALDLLGVLWTYSSSGGDATRLTSDLYDIAQPDWAPDGRTIVFQSYRDGVFNLWTITPDGTQARQLTAGSVRPPRAALLPGRPLHRLLQRPARQLRRLHLRHHDRRDPGRGRDRGGGVRADLVAGRQADRLRGGRHPHRRRRRRHLGAFDAGVRARPAR